jgi:hypothetical protein
MTDFTDFDSQFDQRNHTGTAHESREDEDQGPEDDLPWLKF